MLKYPAKDPAEVLDYVIDFGNLLESGLELDTSAVVVESADPSESPMALEVSNVSLVNTGSPEMSTKLLFWLSGGTVGTSYVLKATVSDSQNTPEDRTFIRRVKIAIKEQ